MTNENVQRVGVLASVPFLLKRFNIEPGDVLKEAGLDSRALDNPEHTIPYFAAGCVLQIAATRTQCPHFGLLIGQQIRTASIGPVGELMRNAPTLGAALEDFVANQHRNAHGSLVYLSGDKHQVSFGYAVYEPRVPGGSVICDAAAMAALSLIRELSGATMSRNIEVSLCRPAPQNLRPYTEHFGVKPRFDASETAVHFPRHWSALPVAGANPRLRLELEKQVSNLWCSGELDLVTRLRRAIRIALTRRRVSVDELSTQLGVGRRTLLRRLGREGLSFQDVLDQTRCELAKQLLEHTKMSTGEIADVIGYGDPSVLTRAFSRWTSSTPSEWRKLQRSLPAHL